MTLSRFLSINSRFIHICYHIEAWYNIENVAQLDVNNTLFKERPIFIHIHKCISSVKCANSRFLKQYRVPWREVCNCEFPICFTVMPLKYLCNIKALNYIENKFRCYFRLLFIQYNFTWQCQSLVNLSLPYQYTSQGKMGTAGLDESCWILSCVSNFLSTVIPMLASRPTLTPIQWILWK